MPHGWILFYWPCCKVVSKLRGYCLDLGADVKASTSYTGWKPSYNASSYRRTQIAWLLLDCGTDVNTRSNLRRNAYFREQRKRLSEFCAKAEEFVHSVIKAKQQEIISSLEKRIAGIGSPIEKFPAETQPDRKAIESVQNGAGITQSLTKSECAAKPSPINAIIAGQDDEAAVALGDEDEEM